MLSLSLPGSLLLFVSLALCASISSSSTTNSTTNSTASTSSSLSSSSPLSLALTSSSLISSSASTFGSSSSLSAVSSSSSSAVPSSTTNGVGDYVAQGLGIGNPGPTSSLSLSVSSVPSSSSLSSQGLSSNSTRSSTASTAANGLLIAAQNATLAASSASTSSGFNYSGVPVGLEAAGNYSAAVTSAAASSGYWNASSSNTSSVMTTSYVNGSAAVLSCYYSWADWQSSSEAWYFSNNGPYLSTGTYTLNVTVYSTYKLCDGIPRAVVSGQTETSVTTATDFVGVGGVTYQTQTITTFIPPQPIVITTYITTITAVDTQYSYDFDVSTTTSFYTVPTPTCEIAPSDCASIYDMSSNAMWTGGSFNATAMPQYDCVTENSAFATYPCTISIPAVQLVYWPVTLASQDLCVYPNPIDITATPNVTGTPTAVAFGKTITSDENCYLLYPFIFAYGTIGASSSSVWASTLSGGILTVPSSELQSFRGANPGLSTTANYPFNFADLPPNHVPVLAYEGGAYCADNAVDTAGNPFCQTIVENQYAPNLVYPTQFFAVDPALSSCNFDYNGLYDPPTALGTAGYLVGPTTNNGGGGGSAPTTPASPGNSGYPVTPPATTISFTQPVASPTGSSGNSGSGGNTGSGSGDSGTGSGDPSGGDSGTGGTGSGGSGSSGNTGSGSGSNSGAPGPGNSGTGSDGNTGSGSSGSGGGNSGTGTGNGGTGNGNAGTGSGKSGTGAGNAGDPPGNSGTGSDGNTGSNSVPALGNTDPNDSGSGTGAVLTLGNGVGNNAGTVTASANGEGGIVVGGQTITPGGAAATVSGNVISAAQGGSIVVNPDGIAPATVAVSQIGSGSGFGSDAAVTNSPTAVLTLGGEVVTATQGSNGGVVIDGTTLQAGQIATIGSQTVSVAPGGSGVVIAQNGQTSTIPLIAPSASAPKVAVLTLGDGEVVTATSITGPNGTPLIVIGSTTLTSGGAALTTDGVVLSAGPGGLVMSGASGSGSSVAGAVFTIGSEAFTAYESVNGQGATVVVIGSQTLTVGGPPVTLPDGEVVSAGTSGLLMVGGGSISSVPYSAIPAKTTSSADPSSMTILSPSGSAGTATAGATHTSKKSGVERVEVGFDSVLVAAFFAFLGVL